MKTPRVYLDSSVFLAWLQEETGRIEACQTTLDRAAAGQLTIVASTLVLTEVLWLRGARLVPRERAAIVQRFFRRSYIRLVNLDRRIAEAAQTLVWDCGIRPKDAIHVASALDRRVSATVLETFDDDLIGKSGAIGNPPLVIREPMPDSQGSLDFNRPR